MRTGKEMNTIGVTHYLSTVSSIDVFPELLGAREPPFLSLESIEEVKTVHFVPKYAAKLSSERSPPNSTSSIAPTLLTQNGSGERAEPIFG